MKTFRSFLLFLFLFQLALRESFGQENNLTFDHLTLEQGLSDNYVMSMMQDRKGYLWFGTGNGLDKYDGYGLRHYQFDPTDSTSIPKNHVLSLYEDR